MKLKIIDTAHHRNGVAGSPFDVVLFKVQREQGVKVGVLFDDPGACAVLDVTLLAAGDIAFGLNSWRGDEYEPELRRAIDHDRDSGPDAVRTGDASIPQRVDRCDAALRRYSDDGVFTSLIDLLTDAMHWCDATAEDFHYALCLAGKHYVAERNDQPITERKLP
ncbi:MAG TPA: hypothetical protein VMS17_05235 [Gemmataceae bacterium]|nr:hypothetical protein [Gemmataceae bacterium]